MSWIKALWDGFRSDDEKELEFNPPQYFVNVQDNGRLHVAALIFQDVQSERLYAFAYPYNWNDMLAIFRKLFPGHPFIDDIPNLGRDLSKVANQRAEELLKRFGRPGWTSIEESIKEATEGWA
jgi:hypothetical protein